MVYFYSIWVYQTLNFFSIKKIPINYLLKYIYKKNCLKHFGLKFQIQFEKIKNKSKKENPIFTTNYLTHNSSTVL